MLEPKRLAAAGALLLAVVMAGVVVLLDRGDDPRPVTVTWGGSEGHPSCAYDPASRTVAAKIRIDGTTQRPEEVTVTVTAYADENTSRAVGATTRSVRVDGETDRVLVITIAVRRPPHVGEDDETACRLEVQRRSTGG